MKEQQNKNNDSNFEQQDDDSAQDEFSYSNTKSLTDRRNQIIEKYQKVFINTDVKSLTFSPGLITRVELMKLIELVYEKQFESLLKTKTRFSLDAAKLTRMTIKKLFSNNSKAFLQKIVSMIYSAEKYRDVKELNLFLKFLLSKKMNAQYLFYLYLRQHFKIITNTNFMHLKDSKLNPINLSVSYNEGLDIIKKGFYDDEVNQEIVVKGFKEKFKNQKKIAYYDFLSGMCEVELNYEDLEVMTNLIALYTIKSRRNLQQMSFDKETEQEEMNLGDEHHFNPHAHRTVNSGIKESSNDNAEDQINDEVSRERLRAICNAISNQTVKEKLNSILGKSSPIPVVQNKQIFEYLYLNKDKKIPNDQLDIIMKALDKINKSMDNNLEKNKEDAGEMDNGDNQLKGIMKKGVQTKFKTPFQQVLSMKKIGFSPNEQEIQIEMGDELNNFVKKLVYNFIDQNDIMINNLDRHSVQAINQIYKKLYFLCLSVFMKDRSGWNKLLRIKKEDDVEFWDEICGLYDDMIMGNDQDAILRFLHKLFDNQLISKQVIFYLNFYFENEEEINEIKV